MLEAKKLLASFKLNKKKPIIVAVSGGLDSMVLLKFLQNQEYEPIVVHFNHNTRETNQRDEDLIIEYCETNNLKYHIYNILIEGGNFQSKARKKRYHYLIETAKQYNTNYIATAHHLDDLAETVLMKITRGSNLYGYAGINPYFTLEGYIYLKPLLYLSKSDLNNYKNKYEIPYFTDESNYSNNYLRNRYRNTIIPIMKQENDQFLSKILSYHNQVSDAYNYISKVAKSNIINKSFDVSTFINQDIAVQNEMINQLFVMNNIESNYQLITKIREMLLNNNSNNSYDLKGGFEFIKTYNNVFIKAKIENKNFNIKLTNTINHLPNVGKITFLDSSAKRPNNTVKLWYNILSLPLVARRRQPGDKLTFLFGTKKLKNHLIDLKIPPHKREELWLLTDSDNNIIWISDGVYTNQTLGTNNLLEFVIGDY